MARFIEFTPGLRLHVIPAGSQTGALIAATVQLHGHRYSFTSEVRAIDERLESATIALPSEVTLVERRSFYRLLTSIVPSYAARVTGTGVEVARLDARITDISGGGAQLLLRQWIPIGARMRLRFTLDDEPVEADVGALALSLLRSDGRRSLHRANCKFIDVSRAVREQVVRYVFRRQRADQQAWAA